MKCTAGTRFQFHLLNSRLIVYICVMGNFNQKKNALGVSSRRWPVPPPLQTPPPRSPPPSSPLPPPVFLIISSDTRAISPCWIFFSEEVAG